MVVTRVEAVTKTKYEVYIDGQFAFCLYKGELSRYHIEEGQEIPEEVCLEIREEVVLKRAKLYALRLLNEMGRTEAQLRAKLKKSGYPEEITERAMAYVKSFGYVDDQNYARSFVESRKGKKSRKEIYMQLCGKGLSQTEIEQALEECYGREDASEAIRALAKKRHFLPGEADYTEEQKFMAYLVRKGFSYEDVKSTLRSMRQEGPD